MGGSSGRSRAMDTIDMLLAGIAGWLRLIRRPA
jgi:hypothetical protein